MSMEMDTRPEIRNEVPGIYFRIQSGFLYVQYDASSDEPEDLVEAMKTAIRKWSNELTWESVDELPDLLMKVNRMTRMLLTVVNSNELVCISVQDRHVLNDLRHPNGLRHLRRILRSKTLNDDSGLSGIVRGDEKIKRMIADVMGA